jgi:penicillin-binding protein 1C
MTRRAWRKLATALGLAFLVTALPLWIAVLLEPLPEALTRRPTQSLRILDRGGRLISELRTRDGRLAAPVKLDELSPFVIPALLAAEDRRFFEHPGVDPLALARSLAQLVQAREIVSGASTLTQQLARNVKPHPRTFGGKLSELVTALRIELELDKQSILEEYLGRVEFGPNLQGIEAASRAYFDKPARALDLSEAATLAALPRGPTLYDPVRGAARLERRRKRVLERLRKLDLVDAAALERALANAPRLTRAESGASPNQLVAGLASGALLPELGARSELSSIETTLDAELQREVEALARSAMAQAEGKRTAAVVVLENSTGEVLAYLGSHDPGSPKSLGHNDGVRALRQPGSTLKPFLYAALLADRRLTAASILPDLELSLPTENGTFIPQNYDRRFHGPVRLREALGSSLNVPAVVAANQLGIEQALAMLRRAGFASLTGSAVEYGSALALGDGEVRLIELTRAYAMLARGGSLLPERLARAVVDASGRRRELAPASAEDVLDARVAAIISDVLADPEARAGAFGRQSALELPFATAVKTGTSKGYRDNWTLGFTREVTVGVWVGHFDGSPLVRSSGVTGAAPLFREVMLAAMRGREAAPLVDRSALMEVEVCPLSGELPGAACPHRTLELFLPGSAPASVCGMHERVFVDVERGGRSLASCPGAEERVFEKYPPEFAAWSARAGRPVAPLLASSRCPDAHLPEGGMPGALSLESPRDGARYIIDPDRGRQELVFSARAPQTASVRFVLDGREVARSGAPFRHVWALERGEHHLELSAIGHPGTASVRFVVE